MYKKEQEAIRHYLSSYFERAKSQNSRYSIRSMAKKLKMHSGTLSHIINGKRTVSKPLAEKILRMIGLDPQERGEILSMFPKRGAGTPKGSVPESRYEVLDIETYRKVLNSDHLAFLFLLKCVDFSSDPEWISDRLGITILKVNGIMQDLLEAKMITTDGKILRIYERFRSPDDIPSDAIQNFHLQSLDIAKRSLQTHTIAERDFTSITFAVSPTKLNLAKERIRIFQDELLDLISEKDATEVYRLSMELFPLTQLTKVV